MDGPTDASDDAGVATDAVASVATDAVGPPPPVAPVPRVPLLPCRIVFEGFVASEPPRIEVRAWLARLGALTAPMTGGEVAIQALDEGRKERRYRVRMELVLPDGPVVVGSDHPANPPHEDVYVAIRNAFRAARRELETRSSASSPV
jgi:hypothetical protein